ncbi:MAG: murein biosynthesis integral membrane protein MurJ [Candidatus Cloacimonetes bacterium]|nr:murein biosynthesis integral membrane protein MurJ [Candidatus Cloacimonadota bacterium]
MTQRKLARNITVMSIAVFISRIFGLVRDQVMAYFFGLGYLNDAFNVAYNLPNLLRRLFGEGALSTAFVPIYNELGIKEGRKAQFKFALNVLSLLTLILSILTFLGIILSPLLVRVLYPGLAPHTSELAIKLSRIIFPYLFFIGLSSTMIAILNSHDYFFMTGLSSALLNVGMIATVVLPWWFTGVSEEDLIIWAGWGVLLGGFLQSVINLPFLKNIGYSFRIIISLSGKYLKAMWRRLIPSIIGIGIRDINMIADTLLASFLSIGSITALALGNRLVQLPLGIFAISAGTAVLPLYSRNITEKNYADLSENLRFTSIMLACIMLPVTAIIAVFARDFVAILFQHGAFDGLATTMTYQALVYYALGLLFYSLNQTITPLFYANKDTRTPVIVGAIMVGANICLNIILMYFMELRGLALATSVVAAINYWVLVVLLKRKLPEVHLSGQVRSIILAGLISIGVYVAMYFGNRYVESQWLDLNPSRWMLFAKSFAFSVLAFIVFFALAELLKISYIGQIRRTLWSKLLRR